MDPTIAKLWKKVVTDDESLKGESIDETEETVRPLTATINGSNNFQIIQEATIP